MPPKASRAKAVGAAARGRKAAGTGSASRRTSSRGTSSRAAVAAPPPRPPPRPSSNRRPAHSLAPAPDEGVAAQGLCDLAGLGASVEGRSATPSREPNDAQPESHRRRTSARQPSPSSRLGQAGGSYSSMVNAGGASSTLPGFSLTSEDNSDSAEAAGGSAGAGGSAAQAPPARGNNRVTRASAGGRGTAAVRNANDISAGSTAGIADPTDSTQTGKAGGAQARNPLPPPQQQQLNKNKRRGSNLGKGGGKKPTRSAGKGKVGGNKPPTKKKSKVTDEQFRSWEFYNLTYAETEKQALCIAAKTHGRSFFSTTWSFGNEHGTYSWLKHLAEPVVELLGKNESYKKEVRDRGLDPDGYMREFFLSAEGLKKIKAWFKSQKNQAKIYRTSHGQTGASGGKEEKSVQLRQDLFALDESVEMSGMRQTALPPVGGSGTGGDGADDEGSLSWEAYGVSTHIVDARDAGSNLSTALDLEDEVPFGDTDVGAGGYSEEEEDDDGDGEDEGSEGDGDRDEHTSYEPVTSGGGSSNAGVPVPARRARGAAPVAGGAASSGATSNNSPRGQSKGKGRGGSTRHVKQGTHGDFDERAQAETSGLPNPPQKRGPTWLPPGHSGGLAGSMDADIKDKQARTALLGQLVKAQQEKNKGGSSQEDRDLRRDELAESRRATSLNALTQLGQQKVFTKERLKKAALKLLDDEDVVAALMEGDSEEEP